MTTAVESAQLDERRGRRPQPGPATYAFLPWVGQAACRGHGSLFFGTAGERPEARHEREARARLVCLACPVLQPCRHWAREQREYGFWGGESEEERVAAGYVVAMPTGRVAKRIQAIRAAARALSRASTAVTERMT
jgi:WhiB family redox-sensing transcriptional regulator